MLFTALSTTERDFVLKFSALEIYNETIDLRNCASCSLHQLNDQEKGIIVEKLVDEIVNDGQHPRTLIGTCKAQKQVGETSLND
uniref:Putative ovule protein n=1 Tax=Solanum chacoense TaxID=4108 RepID=A0A0V0GSX9_SOLCH